MQAGQLFNQMHVLGIKATGWKTCQAHVLDPKWKGCVNIFAAMKIFID